MSVQVECHAGYRGEETPRRLIVDGRAIEVREVLDQWHGPDLRGFKVRGDDEGVYILEHDEWSLAWRVSGGEGARGGRGR